MGGCGWEGEVAGGGVVGSGEVGWAANREKAESLGVRMRPIPAGEAMKTAHRALSGSRLSDGFNALREKHRLDLSLEALAVDKRFTTLFSDEEANEALTRLLEAGYYGG